MKLSSILTSLASLGVALALGSSPKVPGANHARSQQQPRHSRTPYFPFEELFQLQKKFLNDFVSPGNIIQASQLEGLTPDSVVPLSRSTL